MTGYFKTIRELIVDKMNKAISGQGYFIWPEFNGELRKCLDEYLSEALWHRALELGFKDQPHTEEEFRDAVAGLMPEYRTFLGYDKKREVIRNMLDWAFAKILIMSQDNGYMDGFNAGKTSVRGYSSEMEREAEAWKSEDRVV